MIYCRIVDGRKGEGVDIENPHGSHIMIEVKAIQGFWSRGACFDCFRRKGIIARWAWGTAQM
jgi:hypothetical protein